MWRYVFPDIPRLPVMMLMMIQVAISARTAEDWVCTTRIDVWRRAAVPGDRNMCLPLGLASEVEHARAGDVDIANGR